MSGRNTKQANSQTRKQTRAIYMREGEGSRYSMVTLERVVGEVILTFWRR